MSEKNNTTLGLHRVRYEPTAASGDKGDRRNWFSMTAKQDGQTFVEHEANAKLYEDASEVLHQIGLTPKRLAGKLDDYRNRILILSKDVKALTAERDALRGVCQEMALALSMLITETELSGNHEATDYGWPQAYKMGKAALAKHVWLGAYPNAGSPVAQYEPNSSHASADMLRKAFEQEQDKTILHPKTYLGTAHLDGSVSYTSDDLKKIADYEKQEKRG